MKKLLIVFALLLMGASNSFATHVMAADITYVCLGGNNYEVTLKLYRDCAGSTIGQTTQNVNFSSISCGQNMNQALPFVALNDVSQVCPGQTTTCNGGTIPGTEEYIFRGVVTLTPCTDWVMSWSLCCRNNAITNLVSPGSANLYIENTLNNVAGTCNNSPSFSAIPTPYVCVNQLITYNHGATDIDGDSLYYNFNQPLTAAASPITFNTGYTLLDPVITAAGMNLDQETGSMCFEPTQAQVSVVSVLISEYRNGVLIATYIREMQVVVQTSCTNQPPYTGSFGGACGSQGGLTLTTAGPSVVQTDSNAIEMCPMDSVCFDLIFTDPDLDNITVAHNIGSAIPGASVSITGNGTQFPVLHFCWVPTPLDSGINVFAVNIIDDACPVAANQYVTYSITVFDQPYAGPDQTICGSQTAQLQALGGGGYVWSVITGDPINVGVNFSCTNCDNPVANPAVTTTYLLTSTISAACVNTDTVTIVRAPDYTPSALPDTAVCVFGGALVPVQINTSPDSTGYVYDWDNGGSLSDSTIANPIASPNTTTDYIVTITSPFGCVKTDTATIAVTNFPAISIINPDTLNCPGDSTLLTATAGANYTYSWFPSGETTQSIYADSGAYVAEITVNGCVGYTDTVNVHIVWLDKPIINDTAFCPTAGSVSVPVQNPGSYNYTWLDPISTFGQFGNTGVISQGGSYVVFMQDNIGPFSSGCEIFSDTITVSVIPAPTPSITGNLAYCNDDSTTLSVGGPWNNIQWWSPVNSNDSVVTVGAGTIAVYVEDPLSGCGGMDTVVVSVSDPMVSITTPDSVCPGVSAALISNIIQDGPFSSYVWSTGDTTASSSSTAGSVSLIITDNYGCTDTAYATVYPSPTPNADFLIDPLPQGQPGVDITFTDNSSGVDIVSWFWDFGDGTTDNNQNTTHIYDMQNNYPVTLTVTNLAGCTSSMVIDYLVVSDIIIPNVFTPGNDGFNDFLVFTNLEYFNNHLVIFNRWGGKVFEKDNYQNDWDGDNLSDGTYFFVLTVSIPNDEAQIYKGTVNLMREK